LNALYVWSKLTWK